MLKCCHRCSTFLSLLCSLCHRSDFQPCRMYDCTGSDLCRVCCCFLPISPSRNSSDFPALPLLVPFRQADPSQTHTQTSQTNIPGLVLVERRRKGEMSSGLSVCRVAPSQVCCPRIRGTLAPGADASPAGSECPCPSSGDMLGAVGAQGFVKGKRSIPRCTQVGVGLFWGSQE